MDSPRHSSNRCPDSPFSPQIKSKYFGSPNTPGQLELPDALVHYREKFGVTCPICLTTSLKRLKDEATLSSCAHRFCFSCIDEWSKITNCCPLCKLEFRHIQRVKQDGSTEIFEILSPSVSLKDESEDIVCCQVCDSPHDEHLLLLCDGCDHGYHLGCLNPPLSEVPYEDWFCPSCSDAFWRQEESTPVSNESTPPPSSPGPSRPSKLRRIVRHKDCQFR